MCSILAADGRLNPRMGGPPVRVPIEKEIYDLIFSEAEPDNLWPLLADENEYYRRSLYLMNKRTVRLPLLSNFDQPDTMTSCPVRPTSTHALQALTLLNSDFAAGRASMLAERILRDRETGDANCIRRAYHLVFARDPNAVELVRARKFLQTQSEKIGREEREPNSSPLSTNSANRAAWTDLALALLNSNEFLYVP